MKRTIILVDADLERRRLIAAQLEPKGTGILTAENGPQVIATLESSTPTAVVVNPALVDAETIENITRTWPHLPVIMLDAKLGHDPIAQAKAVAESLFNPRSFQLVQPDEILPFQQYERRILIHALETTGWNVKETARRLQIGRATLYRKIDRYSLRERRNAG
ncbi:MAG: hypothetical protein GY711_11725 [bacterium]|nr:hypothetical protein [bacterium]